MQLLVLLFVSSVTMMASTVISPALPRIAAAFPVDDPHGLLTRTLLTAPSLVTIFAAPLAGLLSDAWRRRPVLLLGLFLFALFGSAGLWVDDFHALMVSRFLLGISVGMLISTSSALMGDYYDGPARARAMGFQGMSNGLGGVVFMVGGGALSALSWRGPFAVYLIGLVFLVLAVKWLPEPARHHEEQVGVADAQAAEGTRWGRILLVYLSGFLGISCFFLIPVNAAFMLQSRFGLAGAMVGLVMASSTVTAAIFSVKYAKIHARLGREGTFMVTFASMAISAWLLSWADSIPMFLFGMLWNGVGIGTMFPNASSSVLEFSAPHLRGRLMGIMGSCFYLGQFMSPLFTAAVKLWWGSLERVFDVAAVVMLVMALGYGLASMRGRLQKTQ